MNQCAPSSAHAQWTMFSSAQTKPIPKRLSKSGGDMLISRSQKPKVILPPQIQTQNMDPLCNCNSQKPEIPLSQWLTLHTKSVSIKFWTNLENRAPMLMPKTLRMTPRKNWPLSLVVMDSQFLKALRRNTTAQDSVKSHFSLPLDHSLKDQNLNALHQS